MPTIADKRKTFRELHASGCFVIPNPWDVGSARYLQHLGFKALASTSAGFAFAQGRPDGAVPRDMMLAHLHELAHASDLPLNADFEAGYADDLGGRRRERAARASRPAYRAYRSRTAPTASSIPSTTRWRACAPRARPSTRPAATCMLVGRAECFLLGRPDLDETIARLKAYANAGADCLYAPGIKSREQIAAVVKAVAPKPVNVLMSSGAQPLTVVRPRRARRAPHQRRRRARPRRLGQRDARRQADRA